MKTLIFAASLFISCPVFAQSESPANSPEALESMDTAALAELLLPPDAASVVTTHTSKKPHPANPPSGGYHDYLFYASPFASGADGCIRYAYQVHAFTASAILTRGKAREPVTRLTKVAVGPECNSIPLEQFVHMNPGVTAEQGLNVLQWLFQIRELAAADKLPDGFVTCRSEIKTGGCKSGALEALSTLPIEQTYLMNAAKDQSKWLVWVMPTGPGQPYLETIINRSNTDPVVELVWKIPPPF